MAAASCSCCSTSCFSRCALSTFNKKRNIRCQDGLKSWRFAGVLFQLQKTTRWHTSLTFGKPSALLPSNGWHPVEQCQTLSMGALGPNSHQMLLNSTPKCRKPYEMNIRFLGMSVTRLIGKGRSESMRPLTASFESLWLTSELLPMTLALLTIRMMTTNTSQVLQQQLNFPSWLT